MCTVQYHVQCDEQGSLEIWRGPVYTPSSDGCMPFPVLLGPEPTCSIADSVLKFWRTHPPAIQQALYHLQTLSQ